jgi:pyruvate/2-oxoglutarate/acetoin dehydrogenase E1 component
MSGPTCVKDLNAALRKCMQADPRVYVWGEDVLDPYGGAFKVTAGLSSEFPGRVLTTPISEAAIVGMAVGAAMRGLIPVVEIMFGDFLTLAADQLVNHASKFAGMYNGAVAVPLVVRTPMGGGRAYGPTHSQTLEKHLLGVPGLRVVAPSHFLSPGSVLEKAILHDPMPVLFIENKLLYPLTLRDQGTERLHVELLAEPVGAYPCVCVRNYKNADVTPDVTVVAYGGVSRLLEKSLEDLVDEEVWVEAFLPVELRAGPYPAIARSCRQTRRVLLIEESTAGFGWTAEVARGLAQELWHDTTLKLRSLEAAESVVPSQRTMEEAMLPSAKRIRDAVLEIME